MKIQRTDIERAVFRIELEWYETDPKGQQTDWEWKSMEVTHRKESNDVYISFPYTLTYQKQHLYQIGKFLIQMSKFTFED